MFIQCKTFDNFTDTVWINPDQCAILKYHPSDTFQRAGYVGLACGKEYFIQLADFKLILERISNANSAPKAD